MSAVDISTGRLEQLELESAEHGGQDDVDLAECHVHSEALAVPTAKGNHVAAELLDAVGSLRVAQPTLGLEGEAIREDFLVVMHMIGVHGHWKAWWDDVVLVGEADRIRHSRGPLYDAVAQARRASGESRVSMALFSVNRSKPV